MFLEEKKKRKYDLKIRDLEIGGENENDMKVKRENENLEQIVVVIQFNNRIKCRPLDRVHADC